MHYAIGAIAAVVVLGTFTVNTVEANAKDPLTETCPYLTQKRDADTATTQATFNSTSKTLNIKVNRSIPDMFWGVVQSMTKDQADKILQQCPTISSVKIDFQSGQSMVVKRNK